jgi:steroid 5-alpha reductase family enzyme
VNPWLAAGIGAATMSVVFMIAWALARRWGNYSPVDAVWAFGIGLTAIGWLALCGDTSAKCVVAAVMIGLWSLRLGNHLQIRIRRAHPEEDPRYEKLREVWEGRVGSAFFWFFQGQAVSVLLLALPFLLIAADPDRTWSAWEWAGLAVALIGIFGESLADAQMSRFKKGKPDKKEVCRDGLWRWSRHPNYFFEAVIWVGFYCYACGSEWGWAMVYAPAIIIFLLLKVTGIPPTEASAVKRKGDAYRDYQKTTSAFIPWPPKQNAPETTS